MTNLSSVEPEMSGKTPAHPRRLLRVATACHAADVSRSTIYRAINAGQLDLVKIGTAAAITAESFDRWIDGLPRAVTKAST